MVLQPSLTFPHLSNGKRRELGSDVFPLTLTVAVMYKGNEAMKLGGSSPVNVIELLQSSPCPHS